MYRDKRIIKFRKDSCGCHWKGKIGKSTYHPRMGISRLFRLVCTLIQDKRKAYAIDIVIKRSNGKKTLIHCRKGPVSGKWSAKMGKRTWIGVMTLSRLFRSLPTVIKDRNKVYSIDIIIKRRR